MPRTPRQNDVVTLMYVPGESGKIRRYHVRRSRIRKAFFVAFCALAALIAGSVDYVYALRGRPELERLHRETGLQREQLEAYATRMREIAGRITSIESLERKLRVITNLDPSDPDPAFRNRRCGRGDSGFAGSHLALARSPSREDARELRSTLLAGCGESDCLKGGPSDERAHEPRGGARSPVRTGLGFR